MSFRPRLILTFFVLASMTCSCSKSGEEGGAKPAARANTPESIGAFVRMTDANAKSYFVHGVIPDLQGGSWRWVNKRPELRFRLSRVEHQKFAMEFAIPNVTFKDTGPIAITYYVNGHVLDKVSYRKPGNMTFEKPVPADWLSTGAPVVAAAEVDKPWISPKDKTQLGFILVSAGFRQ